MKIKTFTFRSTMPATATELRALHADPKTFSHLTMPPIILQVLRDDRNSLTNGEIAFRLWFGPFPVNWLARHESGPTPESFKDVQVKGPLYFWEHEHVIESTGSGSVLTDRIRFAHKPGLSGLLTRLLFDGLPLRLLFVYRHWQTRRLLLSRQFEKKDPFQLRAKDA